MRKWSTGISITIALSLFFLLVSNCKAGDERRVQYDTVACPDYGQLTGGSSKDCIRIRQGYYVVVEREQGTYAYVRPGGKVDLYWMPLDPVRWKKP